MKLDRSRPFAQTIGDSLARFHQDGRDFDCNDNEIGSKPEVIEPMDASKNTLATAEETVVKRKPGRPAKVTE